MKKINNLILHVADNVLSQPVVEEVYAWSLNSSGSQWRYGDVADSSYESSTPFWGATILSGKRHERDDVQDVTDTPELIQKIWATLATRLKPLTLEIDNIFLNGQTYGLDNAIHTDTPGQEEGWYTALIYINPKWHIDYGGETLFYNQERSEVICTVVPKPGRLAFFDGRHPHWGRPPTKACTDLRITLSFHLKRLADSPIP